MYIYVNKKFHDLSFAYCVYSEIYDHGEQYCR